MTREEAKELLPIIQAFAEGKTIQVKGPDNRWYDYEGKSCKLKFDSRFQDYRIKPEYRPFKDADECWQEMQKHQPFGWIKVKNSNCYKFLAIVQNIGIYSVGRCAYETGFKNFTFVDDTPFGVKIEA